jgi:predicted transcriptional regulator
MTRPSTITIPLSSEVEQGLERLAESTHSTKSDIAGAAIEAFVERELETIEGIQRGLADIKAGRVVPHEEAMQYLYAIIEKAARRKPDHTAG